MTPTGAVVFLLSTAVKASLILTGAFFVTRLMRERPAAERHLVWMLASICVMALPLLSLSLPAWRFAIHSDVLAHVMHRDTDVEIVVVPAHAPHGHAPRSHAAPRAVEVRVAPITPLRSLTPTVAPVQAVPMDAEPLESSVVPFVSADGAVRPSRSVTWLMWTMLVVWLLGASVVAARIVLSLLHVRRIARAARPLLDPALLIRAHGVAAQMELPRAVRFLEGDDDEMPITFGILRPALLLPSSARGWSAARQNAVLRHELAHVRRRDSLSQLIAELGCAVYWFNPLMWGAARAMCVEREHACDDAVLASGSRASDYAAELLDIARSLRAQRTTALAAIAMARPTDLRSRLNALLDTRPRAERTPTTLLVPAWVAAAALAIPLSSLAPEISPRMQPVAVRAPAPPSPALPDAAMRKTKTPPHERQASAPLTAIAVQPSRLRASVICDGEKLTNIQSNTNDDRRTIKWSGPDCSGEVRIDGVVSFDPEFTRITGLSNGGEVRITTEEDRTERRVLIRPAASGVSYEYWLNGDRRELDGAAQAWLGETLQFLFRRLGFMAEERATSILERRGINALLAETEQLAADHARARYLAVLVERGQLEPTTLRRVLDIAGRSVSSDHYRAQIITAVAGNYTMDDAVRDAYIAAVAGMSSDHYRHAAFSTLLDKGELTSAQASAVLRETHRIESDHYRATLLENFGTRYRDVPGIRAAYLDAAAGIRSDHYKAVVLGRLLGTGGLSTAEQARVIDAAATISSDHYRAEILERVAAELGDPALQRSFVRAASGINSDHYLQNVLSRAVRQERLDRSALMAVLEAAAGIRSDHYRAQLLIDVASRHTLTGEVRERFEQLMNGISSSHYRGNVASALVRNGR